MPSRRKFWGVAVTPRERYALHPTETRVLHLSQACLEILEDRQKKEPVSVIVTVDGKEFPIGNLSGALPQVSCDLVFDKDIELSHSSVLGSVHFTGYTYTLFNVEEEVYDRYGIEGYPFAIKERGKVAKPESDDSDSDESDSDSDESDSYSSNEDSSSEEDDYFWDVEESSGDEDSDKGAAPRKRTAEAAGMKSAPGTERGRIQTPQKSTGNDDSSSEEDDYSSDVEESSGDEDSDKDAAPRKRTAEASGMKSAPGIKRARIETPQKSTGAFGSDSGLQAQSKSKH